MYISKLYFTFERMSKKPTKVKLRYEYKYFVPMSKLEMLRQLIGPFTRLDPYAAQQPAKEYTVRSIYFETPDFECYQTKIEGLKHRNKVRLRGYNTYDGTNVVFMEIKRKYEAPILKNRAMVHFNEFKKIAKGEAALEDYLKNGGDKIPHALDNGKRFFYNLYARKMKPVICVVYEREPYLNLQPEKENDLRITLDKNLRSRAYPTIDDLFDQSQMVSALSGYFILEVKFNKAYPVWMKPIIGVMGLHRESASKYCICIDSHNKINTNARYDTLSYGRMFPGRGKSF